MKKNGSTLEQRFTMSHILDLHPTLNDSKLLSLLKTEVQRYERFSEIIEWHQLKENWFYPDEHQNLLKKLRILFLLAMKLFA